MRFSRDHLIFKALCALDEAVDEAKDGPIEPSFALRFALAFLWACSDGKDRGSFDGFWRCVMPRKPDDPYQGHELYYEYAGNHLRGIAKTLGMDFEVELRARINAARGLPPDHRSLLAKRLKSAWADDQEQKQRAHQARYCDLERIDQPFSKRKI